MTARIFLSYSHADEDLRDQLEAHLSSLKHQGRIDTWHDRRIPPGDDFEDAISEELEAASIILLLISSDFIASRYCYGVETARALQRQKADEARLIPIVLRPCDWNELPFGNLQALPTNANPITLWPNIDEAFLDVVEGIKRILNELELVHTGRPSGLRQEILPTAGSPPAHSGPRSSNLGITKSFSDQDRDDFLHEAFAFIAKFFENSLAELSKRNPGVQGRIQRLDKSRFAAVIYQGGRKASACTIALGHDFGRSGDIRYSSGEQIIDSSWSESLSVDYDDLKLFLRPMGMLAFGAQRDAKLTMQGGAELYWAEFIRPLQANYANERPFWGRL